MNRLIDILRRIYTKAGKYRRLRKPLRQSRYNKKYKMTLRDWLIHHQENIVFDQVTWMGVPALKNVLDAWIYQEIIYEVKPDIVIEIGSRYGGSTRFFADLLELMKGGRVISIDIDRSEYNCVHDRVIALTGNSSDPRIIAEVKKICADGIVLVIHDGDHNREQALTDLNNYSPLVSVGSYFIMEDGIVDLFHSGDGLGFKEPGPLKAVEEFIENNSGFVIDDTRERYLLTYNPKGFLKRIK